MNTNNIVYILLGGHPGDGRSLLVAVGPLVMCWAVMMSCSTAPPTTFIDICNIIGYLVSRFLKRRTMTVQLFLVGLAISYKDDVGDQPACPM